MGERRGGLWALRAAVVVVAIAVALRWTVVGGSASVVLDHSAFVLAPVLLVLTWVQAEVDRVRVTRH